MGHSSIVLESENSISEKSYHRDSLISFVMHKETRLHLRVRPKRFTYDAAAWVFPGSMALNGVPS